MARRGTRSSGWHAKRFVRSLVLDSAHFDKEKSEVIAQTNTEAIKVVCTTFSLPIDCLPEVIKGEVLRDPHGRGSMQKVIECTRA